MKNNIVIILFFTVLLFTLSCNPNLKRDKLNEKCIEFDLLYDNSEFIDYTSHLQLNIYNKTLKKLNIDFSILSILHHGIKRKLHFTMKF